MNITFEHNGKNYILEYSKQAVRTMENQGFSLDLIGEKPTIMIPLLFRGAFIMHHRNIKGRQVDEIYNDIDKEDLVVALAEMYSETVNSVIEGDSDETTKKVKWTKNE